MLGNSLPGIFRVIISNGGTSPPLSPLWSEGIFVRGGGEGVYIQPPPLFMRPPPLELPFPGHLWGPEARIPQNCCGDCCGKLPGKLGVLGGVLGELLRKLPGRVPLLFPAVPPAVPPALPPAPRVFFGSFRSSLRSSFGESGLRGPVDGRGNGNSRRVS